MDRNECNLEFDQPDRATIGIKQYFLFLGRFRCAVPSDGGRIAVLCVVLMCGSGLLLSCYPFFFFFNIFIQNKRKEKRKITKKGVYHSFTR